MRGFTPFCALVLVVGGLAPAHAQSSGRGAEHSELQPGARLRIVAPGILAGRRVATLLSRSGDTITIGSPSSLPIAIPISGISSVEISAGKSRSQGALRGLEWGVPIGAALGLVSLPMVHSCRECDLRESPNDAGWVALNAVGGAVWGAGIGALVGRERWDAFDVSRHAALGVRPSGVALAIRLDF
jgi:hypothetical protein